MDWPSFVSGLAGATLGSAVIATLIGAYVGYWTSRKVTELQHALAVEQEVRAEEREQTRKKRESSSAVVEILTEWVRSGYTRELSPEDLWRMQTTYWKNIMWLDADLVKALTPLLVSRQNAPTSNDVIIQARTVLLELREPDLTPDDLVTWPSKSQDQRRIRAPEIYATTDTGVERSTVVRADADDPAREVPSSEV